MKLCIYLIRGYLRYYCFVFDGTRYHGWLYIIFIDADPTRIIIASLTNIL